MSEIPSYNELKSRVEDLKKIEQQLGRTQKRLDENNKILSVAQRLVKFGAWDWNVRTGEVWWSEGIYSIFGLNPEEFTPQIDSILKLSPKNQQARGQKIIERSIKERKGGTYEQDFSKPDGSKGSYISSFKPFFDEAGEVYRMIGTAVDTTERKKIEEELRHAQKMETIGTLAGGIAHDFNNILFPIMGFAQMSLHELPENHPIIENIEEILKAANRASDLVKRILAFSRQKDPDRKKLLLKPLIQEAVNLLKSIIPANIEIKTELYNGSDYVYANVGEIHEIIMNLCVNAYHAMEDTGGILTVKLTKTLPDSKLNLRPEEYCCLSVSDTGVGIPSEISDKIFDPFFTTKDPGKGSGLGLSVIHGIVQNYKGAIEIHSTSGQGSNFDIYLPISYKKEKREIQTPEKKLSTGNETILLVDDEPVIIKLGCRFLTKLGYSVIGKTSSIEALNVFKSDPDKFDIVITDMTMPGIVGTELAKKIMLIRPDIPIIICTGFSEKVDKETAISMGFKEYIKKPMLTDELSEKIRIVLDQNKN